MHVWLLFKLYFSSDQEYILNQDVKGNLTDNQFEKELYDQSLDVEPRDQPYKKGVSVIG